MYIFLISFIVSLLGITALIGRRLFLLKGAEFTHNYDFAIDVPNLEEIKQTTHKNFKKYSYLLLVITLRIYVLSLNLLKKKYQILKNKIQDKLGKGKYSMQDNLKENKEASKFLKMMSDYKKKIQKIKHRIKEEEGLN